MRVRAKTPYLFILPALIFFLLVCILPMLYALGLGFFSEDYGQFSWCGIQNFTGLTQDREFSQAMFNTVFYALITIPAGLAISLFFAVMLDSGIRWTAFWRTVFFSPSVTTPAAIGYIWLWMYQPRGGLFTHLFVSLGFSGISFLNNPDTALICVALARIWIFLGFQTVIFLAGLQAIPSEVYEAARVDGASALRRFFHITLPLLNPTIVFLAVIGTIKTLQMFTEVYIMTDGGPLGSTTTIVYLIQQTAFSSYSKGYAAAMTAVLFFLILVLTIIQLKFLTRRVEY